LSNPDGVDITGDNLLLLPILEISKALPLKFVLTSLWLALQ